MSGEGEWRHGGESYNQILKHNECTQRLWFDGEGWEHKVWRNGPKIKRTSFPGKALNSIHSFITTFHAREVAGSLRQVALHLPARSVHPPPSPAAAADPLIATGWRSEGAWSWLDGEPHCKKIEDIFI